MVSGEYFPTRIPHPSLSPPGNLSQKKLGVGDLVVVSGEAKRLGRISDTSG
jgi:hypothetical protein